MVNNTICIVKRIILVMVFTMISMVPVIHPAFAMTGEITSGLGQRVNPVTGVGTEGHPGLDVGGFPEGEPVDCPVNGIVISAGDIGDDYGKSVVIKMDEGGVFRLGHNSFVYVHEGEHVSVGQKVALAGSTGRSTGVHVHAEYRPSATNLYDSYTVPYADPGPLLLAAGWKLTGYEGSGDGVIHRFGKSLQELYNKVVNTPLNLDFEYMYKLGGSIRTMLESIVDSCVVAVASLITVSLPLFGVLAIIDLTFFIWKGPAITGQLESAFWTGLIQRVVKYGFIAFVINGWKTIINKVFIGTAQWTFTTFSSDTAHVMSDITAPDSQLQHFMSFLNPSITWLSKLTVLDLIDHMGLFILNMFVTYGSLILFIILIFSLIIVYIEFYLSAVFSVFSIAFSSLQQTTFIAEGMMSHLISGTIRLICIGLVFAIMRKTLETYVYSPTDVFELLGAFLCVIVAVVIGMVLPNRVADGLQISAKL